ncbi:MAG: hypothetical protein ACI8X5_003516 [Planctomycetota bacterium]|jgi:hypothetical protein
MRISKLIIVPFLGLCFTAVASAQFSSSGGGSLIPSTGTGGDDLIVGDGAALYDTVQPGFEATSTVVVGVAVTSIDFITIDGLTHTFVGDTQATLEDPSGIEHLIWLRPGYLNPGSNGSSGDFTAGTYTFVGDGSGSSLPTTSGAGDVVPGTYNQTFDSGGTVWVSGTNGINNTSMNSITGAAGTWTLHIYDWAGGDVGSFSGWKLGGNASTSNSGFPYCFGDGTGTTCPCSNPGGIGEGCRNSSGGGATLVGSGAANLSGDTFTLSVSGAPANKPGIFFQGTVQLSAPVGDGILCLNSTLRYSVNITDALGETSQTGFGVNAIAGQTLNYQFWYRDPDNAFTTFGLPCDGQFNFTGAWRVPWGV